MKITDVRVRILNTNNRLRGIASITIDDAFAVHELRIIEGREGLFVAMPSRKVPDGEFRDVAHPINLETREELEKQFIEKLKIEMAQSTEKNESENILAETIKIDKVLDSNTEKENKLIIKKDPGTLYTLSFTTNSSCA